MYGLSDSLIEQIKALGQRFEFTTELAWKACSEEQAEQIFEQIMQIYLPLFGKLCGIL